MNIFPSIPYDRAAMIRRTLQAPYWLHFGAGNLFRGYIAGIADELLQLGVCDRGVIAAATHNGESVTWGLRPYDNTCISAVLKADGGIESKMIGSIAESLTMAEFDRMLACFRNPSLQMVTLTVTEKGYRLFADNTAYLPPVGADIKAGPKGARSGMMGILTALCYERFQKNAEPIALVSLDNCSRNGELLYNAVTGIAKAWLSAGMVEGEFLAYLMDETKVSFPWSMIDRITPAPSEAVGKALGFGENGGIVKTAKNAAVAPFVNMEEFGCLVIEDGFPNGRPSLERAGVLLCDRETVEKCESMKVYTCLNPLHTALAVLGCLLGFTKISDEMQDADLSAFVEKLGYGEMLPVAVDPGILNARAFLDAVLRDRLPNPFIPDTPQRIAMDTSLKMPIRYGNAIRAHEKKGTLGNLTAIPFVIAAWCRYLTCMDDNGDAFTPSSDPGLAELTPVFRKLAFGADIASCVRAVEKIATARYYLSDLPRSLQELTAEYLRQMLAGPGAVRAALHNIVF